MSLLPQELTIRANQQGLTGVCYKEAPTGQITFKEVSGRIYHWSADFLLWYPWDETPDLEKARQDHKREMRRGKEHYDLHQGEPARIIKLYPDGFSERANDRMVTKVWKHGLGPCGRTVFGLKVTTNETPGWITIWQWCEDKPTMPDTFRLKMANFETIRVYQTDTPTIDPPDTED